MLAIAGGISRFIERPEMFSTLFAVLTYVLLDRHARAGDRRPLIFLPLLCALWANVHAAVIVGLVIQLLFILAVMPSGARNPLRKIAGDSSPSSRLGMTLAFVASVIAAGANPFGYRVLSVPFELTRIIESGVLSNEEWRHPTFQKAPFFFVALIITLIALVRPIRFVNILVGAFLMYVSLRYVRNVGLFCAFVPILTAPALSSASRKRDTAVAVIGVLSLLFVTTTYYPFQRGVGEASYFPDGLVRFTRQSDLRGHMLNSYGFGGYLIWTLWPERQVFIDGRNEVFLPLMQRLAVARSDSRAWNKLLSDYAIEYALLEYVDELERVTVLASDGKATTTLAPMTATRFPRSRWALAYWDDDGMVFIKRHGVNRISNEYGAIYPEGRGYQQQMIARGVADRAHAIAELQRKLREDPSCRRAQMLLRSIQNR